MKTKTSPTRIAITNPSPRRQLRKKAPIVNAASATRQPIVMYSTQEGTDKMKDVTDQVHAKRNAARSHAFAPFGNSSDCHLPLLIFEGETSLSLDCF